MNRELGNIQRMTFNLEHRMRGRAVFRTALHFEFRLLNVSPSSGGRL